MHGKATIKKSLKYKCALAWNIQEISDVQECTQWKSLKYRNIIFTGNCVIGIVVTPAMACLLRLTVWPASSCNCICLYLAKRI
jgi:hypothetical protein